MLNTYHLFAVPMLHGKFVVPVDLHKKILKFVKEEYKVQESQISCINGFQTHDDFDGKEELNSELNLFFNNYLKLNIEYAWLNVLGKHSYNIPHKHSGDGVSHSGILYLSVENTAITFVKDGDIFEVTPKLFEFLIFPYDLVHYVLPLEKNEKRISYAFNLRKIGEKNVT